MSEPFPPIDESPDARNFYIAKAESGYDLEIWKDRSPFDGSFRVSAKDEFGSYVNDAIGLTEAQADEQLGELLKYLDSRGFEIEEHSYRKAVESPIPGQGERASSESSGRLGSSDRSSSAGITQDHRAGLAAPDSSRPDPQAGAADAEPGDLEIAFGDIALGAGKAVVGTAIGIGVGIAAGPVVGAGIVGGLIFHNFMNRYGEAAERGAAEGAWTRALTAAVSDIMPIPVVEGLEAWFGYDYVTRRSLSNSERNQILGGSIGGFGPGAAGGALGRAPLPRQAMRDATAVVISSLKSRENYYLKQEGGQVYVGLGVAEARLNPNVASIGGGGDVGLRPLFREGLKRVKAKTGLDPRTLMYSRSPDIWSFRALKDLKSGLGSHHLIPGEWFAHGPPHLRALYEYVPSILLSNDKSTPLREGPARSEHQGTYHGTYFDEKGEPHPGLNEWLRKEHGLFQKGQYSQQDIARGMAVMEKFFRDAGPHEPWRSYADAVRQFRTEVFNKVKK